ncbi:MAG: hypothetical protein KGJ13_05860 [Patescibacteria group bacterium]|nr:hypothetical protein [Patescibacteria group bacterium]
MSKRKSIPAIQKAEIHESASMVVPLSEREAILSKFPDDYQSRYRGLYEKWKNPNSKDDKSLTARELQELMDIGLVKKIGATENANAPTARTPIGELPEYCGQADFARLMTELYGVAVYPMQVSRAINKEGMPGKMSNGSLRMALAHPWWEEHKVKSGVEDSLTQKAYAAKMQRDIDLARQAKMEADEMEREMDARWILKADAQMTVTGAILKYHSFVKSKLENFTKKLNPKQFTDDQLQQVKFACGQTLQEIEDDSESYKAI